MPRELRLIIFDFFEIREALNKANLKLESHQLPEGQITRAHMSTVSSDVLSLLIKTPEFETPITKELPKKLVKQSLVEFCEISGIELPVRYSKNVKVANGKICLEVMGS